MAVVTSPLIEIKPPNLALERDLLTNNCCAAFVLTPYIHSLLSCVEVEVCRRGVREIFRTHQDVIDTRAHTDGLTHRRAHT